ncbi:MAG: ABC transporter ATP-binding protein [Atopobiaceae bacterium]|nr:ABC transporter ATP-binding protein [Olsenella sp.]MDY3900511.1 ABC transporter ATP-binding protein [Atopobiaceae bacterium]
MAEVQLKSLRKVYPHERGARHGIGKKRASQRKSNLEVTDEGVVAVQDFDLTVHDKEFVVLVGPSGCGKSTTLRMIAGLEDITSGDLLIDGKRVNDVAPKDRDIAMVFQSYALYPNMTVYENMAFTLRLKKVPDAEVDEKVRAAAKTLGITEYLDRKPRALSGGQRQRVAIGRAIVRNPKVFLMDEPLSNLDAKLRNQMRAELIKLRHKVDGTFVYVTHDQTEAMTLGDRIVVMRDGYVQQVGTPQEVFDHPANLFVAGFIGMPQMNFFPAALRKAQGGYELATDFGCVPLSERTSRALAQAGAGEAEVTAGVRPEQIQVHATQVEGALHAVIDVSELMGSTVHVHARVGANDFVFVVPTAELSREDGRAYADGDEIWFTFEPNAVHLFDRATEKNLI